MNADAVHENIISIDLFLHLEKIYLIFQLIRNGFILAYNSFFFELQTFRKE